MTSPAWPFSWPSPDSWGTDVDDTVEMRAQTADLWQEFPVHKLRVGQIIGRVSMLDVGPPSWEANVLLAGSIRDLGWFHTADEAKAAVEQVIGELAAET